MSNEQQWTRRRAVGVVALGAGAPLLAACGSDADTASDPTTSEPAGASPSPTEDGSPTTADSPSPPAGLVAASDVPVGGGVILSEERVVVTQPAEGEFKGFTAVCTHQGCVVARVESEIECDCHGSRFAVADGSVVNGPAASPLSEVGVEVVDGQVVRS